MLQLFSAAPFLAAMVPCCALAMLYVFSLKQFHAAPVPYFNCSPLNLVPAAFVLFCTWSLMHLFPTAILPCCPCPSCSFSLLPVPCRTGSLLPFCLVHMLHHTCSLLNCFMLHLFSLNLFSAALFLCCTFSLLHLFPAAHIPCCNCLRCTSCSLLPWSRQHLFL
jgi:hypothetical protein